MSKIVFSVNAGDVSPAEVTKLYGRVGWNGENHRTEAKTVIMLEQTMFYVTATLENRLIGFGRILGDAYTGQLLDIMTDPDFRRQGIAGHIIRLLLKQAESRFIGLSLIDGTGRPEFYERFGFVQADAKADRLMYLEESS